MIKQFRQKTDTKLKIIKKVGNSYGITKLTDGYFRIVRNIKDYDNEEEAISDLIKLVKGEIKEEDL